MGGDVARGTAGDGGGKRVSPFSNGSEWRHWRSQNCDQCRKDFDEEKGRTYCDIEMALALACVDDGTIPADIAKRSGLDQPWDSRPLCPEFEPIQVEPVVVPTKPLPGQRSMAFLED